MAFGALKALTNLFDEYEYRYSPHISRKIFSTPNTPPGPWDDFQRRFVLTEVRGGGGGGRLTPQKCRDLSVRRAARRFFPPHGVEKIILPHNRSRGVRVCHLASSTIIIQQVYGVHVCTNDVQHLLHAVLE